MTKEIIVEANVEDWSPPEFNLRVFGISHEIHMSINTKGDVELTQDGHGGWECCSYHNSYFTLDREHAIILRDFLNKWIINEP